MPLASISLIRILAVLLAISGILCVSGCQTFPESLATSRDRTQRTFATLSESTQLAAGKTVEIVRTSARLISSRIPAPKPSQNRSWQPNLAVLPYAVFDGNEVEIRNIRNSRYRTNDDYDVRHYDLAFELSDVRSVDFIVVPFDNAPMLAHTMLSFGLDDGHHFAISVEARLETDEAYSATLGSTRKYELMYVIADEQDVLPLRTIIRDSDVYLYRGNATPDQAQDLLVDVLRRTNDLSRSPEFYDTLTNNCTTNLVDHVNTLRPGKVPFDLRVILPGHSDSLAYKLGLLRSGSSSFSELKSRSKINTLVELYNGNEEFSQKIRQR